MENSVHMIAIKRILTLAALASGIIMIIANLSLRSVLLGSFGVVLYFISTSHLLHDFVGRLLRIQESAIAYLLSSLVVLFLLSLLIDIPIMIFEIDYFILSSIILAVAVACVAANRVKPIRYKNESKEFTERYIINNRIIIKAELASFLIFLILGFYALNCASTGEIVISLWDRIQASYVYIVIVETFLILTILLSNIDYRIRLSFLLLFFLMQHSYMPIIYQMGYGGDMWSELADSRQLFNEGSVGWTLFEGIGLGPNYLSLGPLLLPAAFFTKSDISSVGLSYMLHSITNIDMLVIHKWLSPMMWSFFIPIILYLIGLKLSKNREEALLLGFLPSIFYFMIIFGSHTLSVSTGMVFFVFYLLCYISIDKMTKTTAIAIFSLSISFIFQHLLIFTLSIFFIAIVAVIRVLISFRVYSKRFVFILISSLSALLSLFIPYLDAVFNGSAIFSEITAITMVDAIKRWFVDMSGMIAFISPFYAENDPVPLHAIKNANTYEFAFGSGALRGTIVMMFWIFAIIGVVYLYRKKFNSFLPLFSLLIITQLSTFVGWYLMEGLPLGVNRLDLPRELFLLFFAGAGLWAVFEKIREAHESLLLSVSFKGSNRKISISMRKTTATILLIIFLTISCTSAYTLNPRSTNAFVPGELDVYDFINKEIQLNDKKIVVLGDESIYRGLNYVSGNQILYGNVIDKRGMSHEENIEKLNTAYEFFEKILKNPNISDVRAFADQTNSEVVYIILPPRLASISDISDLFKVFGEPLEINGVFIFRVNVRS